MQHTLSIEPNTAQIVLNIRIGLRIMNGPTAKPAPHMKQVAPQALKVIPHWNTQLPIVARSVGPIHQMAVTGHVFAEIL
jgi:hypothetical protein